MKPRLLALLVNLLLLIPTAFAQSGADGERIFQQIKKKHPKVKVWGFATSTPFNPFACLTVVIPEREWAALSKADQISLTFYVESQVPKARANPAAFDVTKPGANETADSRETRLYGIRQLKDDAWMVCVGTPRDNIDEIDRFVVASDRLCEVRKEITGKSEAIKASEFRGQESQKQSSGEPSDPVVASALTKNGLKFTVDKDGDFKLRFSIKEARTQAVWISSKRNKIGNYESRKVFSIAHTEKALPSADLLGALLVNNSMHRTAAW